MNVTGPMAAQVEEVSTLLVPTGGVSVYQALRDAQLAGFRAITVHDDNTATIEWFRRA